MSSDTITIVFLILQIVLLFWLLFRSSQLIVVTRASLSASFFTFALAALLVDNLYWLALSLLMPGVRVHFAVNDIAESTVYLLLAAHLASWFRNRHVPSLLPSLFASIFAAVSIIFWIAWSGEWVKDILGGLMFGYYLIVAARSLVLAHALSRKEWRGVGIVCGVLVLDQAALFILPLGLKAALDALSYVLIFSSIVWCFWKVISISREDNDDAAIALCHGAYAWYLSCLYMSAVPMYFAVDFSGMVLLTILYQIVSRAERRRVDS